MRFVNRMSHVDEAGFFHIDMRGILDVHLKYGPWESNLPVFRWGNDAWQLEPHDPGIPLLHLTDITKPDLPINQFAAAIPLNFRKKLSRFDYLQTTLLQWMARYEDRAAQLLNRCPLLLWMLAQFVLRILKSYPELHGTKYLTCLAAQGMDRLAAPLAEVAEMMALRRDVARLGNALSVRDLKTTIDRCKSVAQMQ